MTIEKNKKISIRRHSTTWFLVFLMTGFFLFGKNVLAVGDYNKVDGSRLNPSEWNNLINDFVTTWATSTMAGPLGIGTAPSAALDVFGKLKFTSGGTIYNTDSSRYLDMTGILTDSLKVSGDLYSTAGELKIAGTGASYLMGNVGIGTTNPTYKLTVSGEALITNYLNVSNTIFGQKFSPTGVSVNWIGALRDNAYRFSFQNASSTELMVIGGNGNVGIGTNNPATARLVVSPSGSYSIDANNGRIGNVGSPVMDSDAATVAYVKSIAAGTSTVPTVGYWTANGANIYNANTGNIGIGIVTPGAKLDVRGNVIFGDSTSNSLQKIKTLSSSSAIGDYSGISFSGWGTTTKAAIGIRRTGSYGVGDLVFFTNNTTDASDVSVSDEKMRITSLGNVGIGTTNPGAKLNIVGDFYADGDWSNDTAIRIREGGDNTYGAFFKYGASDLLTIGTRSGSTTDVVAMQIGRGSQNVIFNGNVGIGSTVPAYKFDVNGTGQFNQPLIVGTPTAASHAATKSYVDSAAGGGVGAGTSGQTLRHNGTNWIANSNLFNNGTNIGIGTTTPASKLTVVGDIRHTGFMMSQGANYTSYWMKFDQDVNGNSLILGAGGLTVVGSGESADAIRTNVSPGTETLYLSSDNNISFQTNLQNGWASSTNAMNITNVGNVGIGFTSPVYTLDVNGTGRFTQPLIVGTPTAASHAATKSYVDSAAGGGVGAGTSGQTLRHNGTNWVANSNLFNDGNNVGIGTTTPDEKLNVIGNIDASDNGSVGRDLKIKLNGKAALTLFNSQTSPDNTILQINRDWDTTLGYHSDFNTVSIGGNVGIGSTAPAYTFDVNGTGRFNQPLIVGTPTAASHAATKSYVDSAAASAAGASWTVSGANIYNSNAGNVGIGTTNPVGKLQVSGGNLIVGTVAQTATPSKLFFGEYSNASGTPVFSGNWASTGLWGIGSLSGTADNTIRIGNVSASSGLPVGWAPTQNLNLVIGGNVGIGTTNPSQKLEVSGTVKANNFYTGYNWTAKTNGLNLGVDGISGGLSFYDGVTSYSASIFREATTSNFYVGVRSGSATSGLTIDYNGNVGVGSTAPSYKLDVAGTGQFTQPLIVGTPTAANHAVTKSYLDSALGDPVGAGTAGQTLRNDGTSWVANSTLFNNGNNIGIGTTNPTSKLDIVGGNIDIDNTTFANQNGMITKNGTRFISNFNYGNNGTVSTDGSNTFVGYASGNLTMGSTATATYQASYNTALGAYTLYNNTTGYSNAVLGQSALINNTTGNQNSAVGVNALYNNTTGSLNSVLGVDALRNNVAGIGGVAVGFQSQYYVNNTSTSWTNTNTSVGQKALFGSSVAANNTGLGNSAFGYTSLYSNSTGSNNTALGQNALFNNTTGNNNTAVGLNSLYSIAGGSQNSALGQGAGRYIADGSTGNVNSNNSLYLGYYTKALADGDTNENVIGFNAVGIGSNSVVLGNDSVTKTALKGSVGIGTTSPAYKLDVAGTAQFTQPVIVGTPTAANHAVTKSYLDSALGDPVGAGTAGQTLRNDGTSWVANSTIYNNGTNVGIGTTNPGYKLEVGGIVSANNNSYIVGDGAFVANGENPSIIQNLVRSGGGYSYSLFRGYAKNTTTGLSSLSIDYGVYGSLQSGSTAPTVNYAYFGVGPTASYSNPMMVLQPNGNVGIGTMTPAYKLDVAGTGQFTQPVIVGTPTATNHAATKSYVDSAAGGGVGAGTSGQTLRHNGTNWVANSTLFNNGTNVGIGTTDPLTKFHVNGADPILLVKDAETSSSLANATLRLAESGAAGILGAYYDIIASGGGVQFSDQWSEGGGTGVRMVINDSGNVGIGSTAPAYTLDVAGTGRFTQPLIIGTPTAASHAATKSYVDSAAASAAGASWTVSGNNIYNSNSGNVGIGTASPAYKLDVKGSGAFTQLVYNGNSYSYGSTIQNAGPNLLDTLLLNNSNDIALKPVVANSTEYYDGTSWVTWDDTIPKKILTSSYKTSAATIDYTHRQFRFVVSNMGWTCSGAMRIIKQWSAANTAGTFTLETSTDNATYTTRIDNASMSNSEQVWIGQGYCGGDSYWRITFNYPNIASGQTMVFFQLGAFSVRGSNISTETSARDYVGSWINSNLAVNYNSGQASTLAVNGTGYFSGNVGIGSASPSYKLDVAGTGQFTQPLIVGTPTAANHAVTKSYFDSAIGDPVGAGTAGQTLRNDGSSWVANSTLFNNGTNIGIGTTNPLAKLDVNGSIFADINSPAYGVAIKMMTSGARGLNFWNASSSQIFAMGVLTNSTDSNLNYGYIGPSYDSPYMVFKSGGNVGVGTTNPNTKLDVSGILSISNGAGTYWGLDRNDADGSLTFSNASTERIRVLQDGSVGIGSTAPSYKLDVAGTAQFTQPVIVGTPTAANHAVTKSYLDSALGDPVGAGTAGQTLRNDGNGWVANSTIYNNGTNVGIGTATPQAKLDVNGTQIFYGEGIPGTYTYATTSSVTLPGTAGIPGLSRGLLQTYNSDFTLWTQRNYGSDNTEGVIAFGDDSSSGLSFEYWGWNGSGTSRPLQLMSMRPTGNVGIGNSNPSAILDVSGKLKFTNGGTIYNTDSGRWLDMTGTLTDSLKVSGDLYSTAGELKIAGTGASYLMGNVGIGTTNPAYPLNLYKASSETGLALDWGATRVYLSHGGWGMGAGKFGIGGGAPLIVADTNTSNVGIGTTAPTEAKLVINAGTGAALKAYGNGIFTGTLQTQTGSDFAEEFVTSGNLEPGTVVVMDDNGHKSVKPCAKSYDKTVVGIVSNDPSIIAGRVNSEHKAIIAMMGVVKVKVSNINGNISKGDLLTTSGIYGYAMKANDTKPGTVIGKALENLNKATGEINVLVNLQ